MEDTLHKAVEKYGVPKRIYFDTGDLDAFYAQLTTPVTVPALLKTSFADHAQKLIDGSEDVAAATAGVQSDLALYLAEQQ